ncbi:hypothetical protein Ciccas_000939 [Cichlidogyrus casuarinus]|uniref:Uncharacterized protein n=1 Tax=Cichlidogyrus casuarinus TaxID=1844966 RepID=A0ABD2QLH3_9PLAT
MHTCGGCGKNFDDSDFASYWKHSIEDDCANANSGPAKSETKTTRDDAEVVFKPSGASFRPRSPPAPAARDRPSFDNRRGNDRDNNRGGFNRGGRGGGDFNRGGGRDDFNRGGGRDDFNRNGGGDRRSMGNNYSRDGDRSRTDNRRGGAPGYQPRYRSPSEVRQHHFKSGDDFKKPYEDKKPSYPSPDTKKSFDIKPNSPVKPTCNGDNEMMAPPELRKMIREEIKDALSGVLKQLSLA